MAVSNTPNGGITGWLDRAVMASTSDIARYFCFLFCSSLVFLYFFGLSLIVLASNLNERIQPYFFISLLP